MLDYSVTLDDSLQVYNNSNEPKDLWVVKNAVHTGAFDVSNELYKKR